jgi:hypothetical protein
MTWSRGRSALLGALGLAIGAVVMLLDGVRPGAWIMLGAVDVALYIELVGVLIRRGGHHGVGTSLEYALLLAAMFVVNVITLGLMSGVHAMAVTGFLIIAVILLVELLRSLFTPRS